ncbi:MAG: GNAT family N-acetyltransferase [Lachnospiraceae bacterium]|nr:GNAT family N-acetyltransferase [Lachnospiraceae bacterium]
MDFELIGMKKELCSVCGKEHNVKTIEIVEHDTIKGVNIVYPALYQYCDNNDKVFANKRQEQGNFLKNIDAYRKTQGLLTSDEIIFIREKYDINQTDLCQLLGWGLKTVARYETRFVQDKAHDSILRKLDKDPEWFLSLLEASKDAISEKNYKRSHEIAENLLNEKKDVDFQKERVVRYAKSLDMNGQKEACHVVIETERLRLREMTLDDFDALKKVIGDDDNMQYYPKHFDDEKVKNWIEWNLTNYSVFGFGLWAMILKETGEMIGDCGLTMQIINGAIKPEIGYHVRKDCHKKGYAKEAGRAVRDWTFNNLCFNELYSYMDKANKPSYRTALSLGMKMVDEYIDKDGVIDRVCAIRREEWEEL